MLVAAGLGRPGGSLAAGGLGRTVPVSGAALAATIPGVGVVVGGLSASAWLTVTLPGSSTVAGVLVDGAAAPVIVFRPDLGGTGWTRVAYARPDSGATAKPYSGLSGRPDAGASTYTRVVFTRPPGAATGRPDTGSTVRPT